MAWSLHPNYQEYYKLYTKERLQRHRAKPEKYRPMEPYHSNKEYHEFVADYEKGTDSEWNSEDEQKYKAFNKNFRLRQTSTDDEETEKTITTDSDEVAKHVGNYVRKLQSGEIPIYDKTSLPKGLLLEDSEDKSGSDSIASEEKDFTVRTKVKKLLKRQA